MAAVRPLVDADVDFLDCSGRWSEVGVATHYKVVAALVYNTFVVAPPLLHSASAGPL